MDTRSWRRAWGPCLAVMAACAGGGCGSDGAPAGPGNCTQRFQATGDVQTAVQMAFIEARAGSTLCFDPGTYRFTEELSITTRGITLKGTGAGVVFDFGGQRGGRASVNVTGSDFTVEDLTIKNVREEGLKVSGATNVTFRRVRALWDAGSVTANGAYALYPVTCTNVLIEDCEVVGASDAGIYVGQSSRIVVRRNDVHGNVAGIEIENSADAEVYQNRAYDNTAGILVFDLPNLPVQGGRRSLVRDNTVEGNNRANFAGSGVVREVPAGTGVVVMSADQVEVRSNTIRNNETTGVLILSYFAVQRMGSMDMRHDPYPQGIWIRDNTFASNGANPSNMLLRALGPLPLEDVIWDGYVDPARAMDPAARICLTNNTGARFRNADLMNLGAGSTTDAAPHACSHTPLGAVTLP